MSTPMLILAVLAAIAVLAVRRMRESRHTLPRHRVRSLRLRLHLRLHPGPGHASGFELWHRWGRFASWRESKRTRPGLTRWQRTAHPSWHSFFIGWAHHFRRVRVTVQEHMGLLGPPRSHKTALMSRVIMNWPGPVVCASSKADLAKLVRGVRARRCGPVYYFNPQGWGGIPNTVQWSPLDGADVAAVAIRRASAFAEAVSVAGTEDGTFWSGKASDGIRGMLRAAALGGYSMPRVGRWAGAAAELVEAVQILARAEHGDWAVKLAELISDAQRTSATVRMVISRALGFLDDPALAAAVMPPPGGGFDIDKFLAEGCTLCMIARSQGDDNILAPLFTALASEIHYRAVELGSRMPEGRLDPPLLLAPDEVTQICPLPLAALLADSGGQGISVCWGAHGVSQLRGRWGADKAQSILDTTNCLVYCPGIRDPDTLENACRIADKAAFRERGGQLARHDVLTPGMIRGLPKAFALILRNGFSPLIFKVAAGWRHPELKAMVRAERRRDRRAKRALRRQPLLMPQHEQIGPALAAITGTVVDPPRPAPEPAAAPEYPWRRQP